VQLADDSLPNVSVSDDGKVGVGNSRERYMIEQMWGDGGTDVYVVDPVAGTRKIIREKISGNAQLSPDAKYVTFYRQGSLVHLQHCREQALRSDGWREGRAFRAGNG
jgi:hypothetical protein